MKKLLLALVFFVFSTTHFTFAQPDLDSATREVNRPFRQEAEKEMWRVPKKPEIKIEDSEGEEDSSEEGEPSGDIGGCISK